MREIWLNTSYLRDSITSVSIEMIYSIVLEILMLISSIGQSESPH